MAASGYQHIQEATDETMVSIMGGVEVATPGVEGFPGFDNRRASTDPPKGPEERPRPVRQSTIDPGALPENIPPEHSNRTLILCFDGTGDQFDVDNSNIVQLVALLKKNDSTKQLVYYQSGIGTYTTPKVASPLLSQVSKILDTMFALNLNAHVMSGYEFLMNHYVSGDKICIFGFSRGAYTARSLAGMLHKVGLLPAGNLQQVPFAYKMYTRTDNVGWEQSTEFKKAFCVDVPIEFIGVWDTVDSVGIIPKRLPFTTSNTIVRTFRHAVSLDERRAKFKANLWNRPTEEEQKLGTTPYLSPPQKPTPSRLKGHDSYEEATKSSVEKNHLNIDVMTDGLKKIINNKPKEDEDDKKMNAMERMYSEEKEKTTDIEEVWFAGCHCDVGGGSVSNKTRHSLARIPLRWMIRECFKANTGIMFNSTALYDIGLDPNTLYPFVSPRPLPRPIGSKLIQSPPEKPIPIRTSAHLTKKKKMNLDAKAHLEQRLFLGAEEDEELEDALSPKYDQLRISKWWWILEILPLQLRYQRGNNEWVTTFGSNFAKPRFIPKQKNGFKVHRSVKLRMEAEFEDEARRKKGKKYNPKPVFLFEPTWVD